MEVDGTTPLSAACACKILLVLTSYIQIDYIIIEYVIHALGGQGVNSVQKP
jgi:hypothetical protein